MPLRTGQSMSSCRAASRPTNTAGLRKRSHTSLWTVARFTRDGASRLTQTLLGTQRELGYLPSRDGFTTIYQMAVTPDATLASTAGDKVANRHPTLRVLA